MPPRKTAGVAGAKAAAKQRTPGRGAAAAAKQAGSREKKAPRSMPKEGRDPKGGLTAKGREFFNKKEGSHLRPGVQGKADTPEKMVRKGSFLRRHFTHPRGPMVDDKGQPTRLALSAHAWGEPVPKTLADARKLAQKGHKLLEKYHSLQEGKAQPKKPSASKRSAKKVAVKKVASKVTARQKAPRKTAAGAKQARKKTASRKTTAKRPARPAR